MNVELLDNKYNNIVLKLTNISSVIKYLLMNYNINIIESNYKNTFLIPDSINAKKEYIEYMNKLLIISEELDDDYLLPLSMLNDMIISLDIKELIRLSSDILSKPINKEIEYLGNLLKKVIIIENPELLTILDNEIQRKKEYNKEIINNNSKTLQKPGLIMSSEDKVLFGTDTRLFASEYKICLYHIMKKYNLSFDEAENKLYYLSKDNSNYKIEQIDNIINSEDINLLETINYHFEIPCSIKAITKFNIRSKLLPDIRNINHEIYYNPSTSNNDNIYRTNNNMIDYFKISGLKEEDLIYLYINANKLNMSINTNAKELLYLSNEIYCEEDEELKNIMNEIIKIAKKNTPIIASYFAPTCETFGYCLNNNMCHNNAKVLKK